MHREKVPQNTGVSFSPRRRLLANLQSVYQKVIQSSEFVPSLRCKHGNSQRSPFGSRSSTYIGSQSLDRRPLDSDVSEIVIQPLPFHNREKGDRYGSHLHTPSVSTDDSSEMVLCDFMDPSPPKRPFNRSVSSYKAPTDQSPTVYSEQSIRYAVEQVAVEQARRLKRRSGIHPHRIDMMYFVSGFGLHLSTERSNSSTPNGRFKKIPQHGGFKSRCQAKSAPVERIAPLSIYGKRTGEFCQSGKERVNNRCRKNIFVPLTQNGQNATSNVSTERCNQTINLDGDVNSETNALTVDLSNASLKEEETGTS